MSNTFSSIKQGLEEALEFSKGNASKAVIHEFAAISVKDLQAKAYVLRNSERVNRTQQYPALNLPNVLDK